MSTTSSHFALVVLASLVAFCPVLRRPQNCWLFLISYTFHMTWAWQFPLALLLLTLATYGLACRLLADNQSNRELLWERAA